MSLTIDLSNYLTSESESEEDMVLTPTPRPQKRIQFPINCMIDDPYMCGVEWDSCGNCPKDKQNVPSLVKEIESIGYKISSSQLAKLKVWSAYSVKDNSWALYHIESISSSIHGKSVKHHKCLTLIKYPDEKRMVFKPK
tara:strand:+ start:210 stop:626 length:417 start_codon:yes stop_codon:yes gene_type:complete